jgi:hypothetical protein
MPRPRLHRTEEEVREIRNESQNERRARSAVPRNRSQDIAAQNERRQEGGAELRVAEYDARNEQRNEEYEAERAENCAAQRAADRFRTREREVNALRAAARDVDAAAAPAQPAGAPAPQQPPPQRVVTAAAPVAAAAAGRPLPQREIASEAEIDDVILQRTAVRVYVEPPPMDDDEIDLVGGNDDVIYEGILHRHNTDPRLVVLEQVAGHRGHVTLDLDRGIRGIVTTRFDFATLRKKLAEFHKRDFFQMLSVRGEVPGLWVDNCPATITAAIGTAVRVHLKECFEREPLDGILREFDRDTYRIVLDTFGGVSERFDLGREVENIFALALLPAAERAAAAAAVVRRPPHADATDTADAAAQDADDADADDNAQPDDVDAVVSRFFRVFMPAPEAREPPRFADDAAMVLKFHEQTHVSPVVHCAWCAEIVIEHGAPQFFHHMDTRLVPAAAPVDLRGPGAAPPNPAHCERGPNGIVWSLVNWEQHPPDIQVCQGCAEKIRANKANTVWQTGYDWGRVRGTVFERLSDAEKAFIAKNHPLAKVIRITLESGAVAMRGHGHVITFPQDSLDVFNAHNAAMVLPRADAITNAVQLHFVGPRRLMTTVAGQLVSVNQPLHARVDAIAESIERLHQSAPGYLNAALNPHFDAEAEVQRIIDGAIITETGGPREEDIENPPNTQVANADAADDDPRNFVETQGVEPDAGFLPAAARNRAVQRLAQQQQPPPPPPQTEGQRREAAARLYNNAAAVLNAAVEQADRAEEQGEGIVMEGAVGLEDAAPNFERDADTFFRWFAQQGEVPLNEFANMRQLIVDAFPWLFPLGGFLNGGYPSEKIMRHLMRYYDGRFQKDALFMHFMNNLRHRHGIARGNASINIVHEATFTAQLRDPVFVENLRTGVQRRSEGAALTAAQQQALRDTENAARIPQRRVAFSEGDRVGGSWRIQSLIRALGLPSFMLTISPTCVDSSLGVRLCCGPTEQEIYRIADRMNYDARARLVFAHPASNAIFFEHMIKKTLEILLGAKQDGKKTPNKLSTFVGPLGTVREHFGAVECQGRTLLHLHLLLWTCFGPTEIAELMRGGGLQRVIEYIDRAVLSTMPPEYFAWRERLWANRQHVRAAGLEVLPGPPAARPPADNVANVAVAAAPAAVAAAPGADDDATDDDATDDDAMDDGDFAALDAAVAAAIAAAGPDEQDDILWLTLGRNNMHYMHKPTCSKHAQIQVKIYKEVYCRMRFERPASPRTRLLLILDRPRRGEGRARVDVQEVTPEEARELVACPHISCDEFCHAFEHVPPPPLLIAEIRPKAEGEAVQMFNGVAVRTIRLRRSVLMAETNATIARALLCNTNLLMLHSPEAAVSVAAYLGDYCVKGDGQQNIAYPTVLAAVAQMQRDGAANGTLLNRFAMQATSKIETPASMAAFAMMGGKRYVTNAAFVTIFPRELLNNIPQNIYAEMVGDGAPRDGAPRDGGRRAGDDGDGDGDGDVGGHDADERAEVELQLEDVDGDRGNNAQVDGELLHEAQMRRDPATGQIIVSKSWENYMHRPNECGSMSALVFFCVTSECSMDPPEQEAPPGEEQDVGAADDGAAAADGAAADEDDADADADADAPRGRRPPAGRVPNKRFRYRDTHPRFMNAGVMLVSKFRYPALAGARPPVLPSNATAEGVDKSLLQKWAWYWAMLLMPWRANEEWQRISFDVVYARMNTDLRDMNDPAARGAAHFCYRCTWGSTTTSLAKKLYNIYNYQDADTLGPRRAGAQNDNGGGDGDGGGDGLDDVDAAAGVQELAEATAIADYFRAFNFIANNPRSPNEDGGALVAARFNALLGDEPAMAPDHGVVAAAVNGVAEHVDVPHRSVASFGEQHKASLDQRVRAASSKTLREVLGQVQQRDAADAADAADVGEAAFGAQDLGPVDRNEALRRAGFDGLVDEQRRVVACVLDAVLQNEEHRRALQQQPGQAPQAAEPQRFFWLFGEGGTGKTFSTRILMAAVRAALNDPNAVLPCAFQGNTAANLELGASTIHTAFGLNARGKEFWLSNIKAGMGDQAVRTLKSERPHLALVVTDEISMVNAEMLALMDRRLRSAYDARRTFGGVVFLVIGDFLQLRPIPPGMSLAHAVVKFLKREALSDGDRIGGELFLGAARLQLLQVQRARGCQVQLVRLRGMRAPPPGGQVFTEALWNGVKPLTNDDVLSDAWRGGHTSIHLTNEAREAAGLVQMRRRALATSEFVFRWRVKLPDKIVRMNLGERILGPVFERVPELTQTFLAGGRMMLLQNLNVSLGLTNGALCTGHKLYFEEACLGAVRAAIQRAREAGNCIVDLGSNSPKYVDLAFDIPTVVREQNAADLLPGRILDGKWIVTCVASRFDEAVEILARGEGNPVKVKPEGFKFTQAYAFTINKSQGMSISPLVLDFTKPTSQRGTNFSFEHGYTGISRATSDALIRRLTPGPNQTERHIFNKKPHELTMEFLQLTPERIAALRANPNAPAGQVAPAPQQRGRRPAPKNAAPPQQDAAPQQQDAAPQQQAPRQPPQRPAPKNAATKQQQPPQQAPQRPAPKNAAKKQQQPPQQAPQRPAPKNAASKQQHAAPQQQQAPQQAPQRRQRGALEQDAAPPPPPQQQAPRANRGRR